MKSLRIGSRIAWVSPVFFFLPFVMGADGNGCQPGGPIPIGSGSIVDGSTSDGSVTCTPADCAGLAAPALAKVCSDGTSVGATLCTAQSDGKCGWGFPACPTDACSDVVLPCAGCPYGSTGMGYDSNGCPTCPICAPPPPDACVVPVCNLPNCAVGSTIVTQYGPDGCETCPICVPPDAGSGGQCSIEATSYNQSCTGASDCVAVYSGALCGSSCACANSAINVGAQAQYNTDLSASTYPRCPCPSPPQVACTSGTCGLAAP
jgi:hypothetical protein